MADSKKFENLIGGYSNTAIFRTMAFVGDSLSSGEFETIDKDGVHQYYDLYEYSWGQFLARKNGLKGYNFSRGGMSTKWYLESYAEENGFWDKDKACQAYVIAFGVNDIFHQNIKVGKPEDITATEFEDERTYISYYAEIIRRYKEISPDAKFFFLTLPDEGEDRDIQKRDDMTNALYSLAEHFDNSYVIDFHKCGIKYCGDEFKKQYSLNGHMNPMGYILTAQIIDTAIDQIIRNNPEDFKYVGFIGTDIKY